MCLELKNMKLFRACERCRSVSYFKPSIQTVFRFITPLSSSLFARYPIGDIGMTLLHQSKCRQSRSATTVRVMCKWPQERKCHENETNKHPRMFSGVGAITCDIKLWIPVICDRVSESTTGSSPFSRNIHENDTQHYGISICKSNREYDITDDLRHDFRRFS